MTKQGIRGLLGAGAALMFTGSLVTAHADTLPFTPTLTLGSTTLVNDQVLANGDGSFTMSGEQQGGSFNGGFVWDMQWNLTVSQDPFILGSVTVTNLTTSTRNFAVTLSVPVSPSFSPSLFGGSINGSVTDSNNDHSASLTPNAAVSPAIYRGTIDGSTVLSLFALNLSCSSGTGGCSSAGSDSDGLPGLTLSGGPVTSAIGTLLNFSLSAGDSATFSTNFTVEPPTTVPLPAALPLMLSGLGALGWRRRRDLVATRG